MSRISSKFTQNFKKFELINNEKLLITNDNQSYVILYDLNDKDTFKLVSTNSSKYGFTNCLFRMDNQFLINSFNIDTGVSSLNGIICILCIFSNNLLLIIFIFNDSF